MKTEITEVEKWENLMRERGFSSSEIVLLTGAIARMQEQLAWRKFGEEAPEPMQEVLFTNLNVKDLQGKPVISVHAGWYDRGNFHSWVDPRDKFTATHWRPVPNPPTA